MPGTNAILSPALLSLLGFLSIAIILLLIIKNTRTTIPSWNMGVLVVLQTTFGTIDFLYPTLFFELPLLKGIEFVLLLIFTALLLLSKAREGKNNTLLIIGFSAFSSSGVTLLLSNPEIQRNASYLQVLSGLVIVMTCLYVFIRQNPDPKLSVIRWPFLWITLGSLSFWGMRGATAFTSLAYPGLLPEAKDTSTLTLFFLVIQTLFYLFAIIFSKTADKESF